MLYIYPIGMLILINKIALLMEHGFCFMQEENSVGCLRAAWSSPVGTAARTGIGTAGAPPKTIKAPRRCWPYNWIRNKAHSWGSTRDTSRRRSGICSKGRLSFTAERETRRQVNNLKYTTRCCLYPYIRAAGHGAAGASIIVQRCQR